MATDLLWKSLLLENRLKSTFEIPHRQPQQDMIEFLKQADVTSRPAINADSRKLIEECPRFYAFCNPSIPENYWSTKKLDVETPSTSNILDGTLPFMNYLIVF